MSQPAHLTEAQLAAYAERTLPPLELLRAGDHVAACDKCRAQLYQRERVGERLLSLRSDLSSHLDYGQVVACAENGSLNGNHADALAGHLAECALCREEVADLRQFRAQRNAAPAPLKMPARQPTATGWRFPATIAAVLVVVGLGGLWISRHAQPAREPAAQQALPPNAPIPLEWQQAVEAARTTHQLERAPVLDGLIAGGGVLLGPPDGAAPLALTAPSGTVVLTGRPTFRWQPVSGASQYRVSVFDENLDKVTQSPLLAASEWQPAQVLPAGHVYTWQVSAKLGGETIHAPAPPAPEARFRVAAPAMAGEIETARREHPESHLLLAVMCAKAGALDDAAKELDELAVTDPETAAQLKGSLKALRAAP